MALRDMTLSVLISAKDQLSGVLRGTSGNLNTVEANLRQSAGAAADFNNRFEQMAHVSIAAGVAIAGAGAAITAAMVKATQDAMYEEDVQDKLRRIYPENAAALIEYASAMQKATRFADEHIVSAMQIGATYPRLRGQLEQATETALNMAEAYGVDLVQAMHLLGKASAGQYGMLARYGILIDQTRVKSDGMKEVFRAIGEETKNLAFTTDSASKSYEQMTNAVSDVWESMGNALLPVVRQLTPMVQSFAERMNAAAATPFGAQAIKWAAGLGLVMTAVGPLLIALPTLAASWSMVVPAATAAWAAMTGPVGLAIAGVVAIGAAIYALATASDKAREAQKQQLEDLESGALTGKAALEDMRRHTQGMADDLREVGDAADDTGQRLADMRAQYAEGLEGADDRIYERILQLQEERNLAVQRYGKNSKEALEAENRLLEEQEKRYIILMKQLEQAPVTGTGRTPWLTPNEDLQAARDAIKELEKSFATVEAERKTVQNGLQDITDAQGDLTAVTRQSAEETEALADAQKAGEKAATDYARAQRDAARDVEEAEQRITDAEEAIGEAVADRTQRIEDATRRIADAQRSLADAHEAASDRVRSAEESAARSVESAEKRVESIRRRLADLDAPELSPAQRKEQQRLELMRELQEAQAEVNGARLRGEEDVAKAVEQAARMQEDAGRRVEDAYAARDRAVEEGDKLVAQAQKRKADAEEQYALTVERAGERVTAARDKLMEQAQKHVGKEREINAARVRSIDEVTAAYQRQAHAQAQTQIVYRPASSKGGKAASGGGGIQPQVAYAGAGGAAGGGRIDLYLHTDGSYTVNQAKHAAGEIVGSANGQNVVLRLVRDVLARG